MNDIPVSKNKRDKRMASNTSHIIKEGIPFRREGGAICLIDVFVVVFPEIKCFVFVRKKLLDSGMS